jgi:hypothetical protein
VHEVGFETVTSVSKHFWRSGHMVSVTPSVTVCPRQEVRSCCFRIHDPHFSHCFLLFSTYSNHRRLSSIQTDKWFRRGSRWKKNSFYAIFWIRTQERGEKSYNRTTALECLRWQLHGSHCVAQFQARPAHAMECSSLYSLRTIRTIGAWWSAGITPRVLKLSVRSR